MRGAVTDPAADVRDSVAAASGAPELEDKIWFQKTAAAVIDAGRCVGCGGCIAACPSRSLEVGTDGRPTLVRMCTGCSACWDYCPLAGFRPERLIRRDDGDLGEVRGAWSARALERPAGAQNGGVVTALLAELLEAGEIDGAILTRRIDAFQGEAFLARTPGAVRDAAGSVYHQSHPLEVLNRPLPVGIERIAFVGTPCQLTVLRALQRFPWERRRTAAHAITLTVGLFCTRSFDPVALMRSLLSRGTNIAEVRTLDVRGGELTATNEDGEEMLRAPVREFRDASLGGCDECADFAALSADIAVGNAGSAPGASTVLVRTQVGLRMWEAAAGAFAIEPITDLEQLERAAVRNRRRAERVTPRGFDPDGPLWISYREHLAAYVGTDRAPVAPPDHRSHHYEVSC